MLPDLDSLALFVRISELASITRAAEASFMSLPAASRRITLLEERFGAKLLERRSRGVALTTAGRALLTHSRTLLRAVDQMQTDMSDRLEGRVRLLATTSAVTHFLPSDIARFARTHPGIQLSIGESWSEEIAHEVTATTADLGIIVEGTTNARDLEALPYRAYHIAVVMPANHPLATVQRLSYEDVLAYEIVALESSSLMMRSLFEHAILAHRTLAPKVQVRSFEAVCRFVHAGLGLGLLPYETAVGLASEMGLAIRRLDESWAERKMVVCVRGDRRQIPAIGALVHHLSRSSTVAA